MVKRVRGIVVVLMATGALACGGGANHLVPVTTGSGGADGGAAGRLALDAGGAGGADASVVDVDVSTNDAPEDVAPIDVSGSIGAAADGPSAADAVDAGGSPSTDGGLVDAPLAVGDGSASLPNGDCVQGAFKHNGGACVCQSDTPNVCGPMCTDVTLDPANCGQCGLACAPTATCNGGQCGPSVRNVVPVASGCGALQIAVANGTLFWTNQGAGTVKSVAVGGGTPTSIAPNEKKPGLILVSGTNLLWIDITGQVPMTSSGGAPQTLTTTSIRRLALPNGVPSDLVAETNLSGGILGMVVSADGNTVYYSSGTVVKSIPMSGAIGGTVVASEELGGIPAGLAIDGDTLAFLTMLNGDLDIVTVNNVDGLSASCGKHDPADPDMENLLNVHCTRVARSQGAPLFSDLLVENGNVFWSNDGSIAVNSAAQVTSMGGFDADNVQVATTGGALVTALAGSATNIYFGSDGVVEKTPYDVMSTAVELARAQASPSSMALDATNVYWSTGDCAINTTGL